VAYSPFFDNNKPEKQGLILGIKKGELMLALKRHKIFTLNI